MIDGALHLNGTPVKRERIADFVHDVNGNGMPVRVKRWRETLPDGPSYETLDTVPAGHYFNFMLGDNRDNSTDSRVLGQIGYVPYDHLVGRVTSVMFSLDGGKLRFGRISAPVH